MLPARREAGTVQPGEFGRCSGAYQLDARSAKKKWGENSVRSLNDREVGVMFWAGRDTLSEIQSLGVQCGQLGVPGDLALTAQEAAGWKSSLDAAEFAVVTVFAAYNGEN